ncbi:hypothetical protein CDG81_05380 [Actinopolyspora erythraea]|uniref:Chaplin n=2 Tax=Actinopolyspora erythraea TaxID=414996 RepID=A0A099D3A2_9ACTN|nr:hypothetical protein [Actinopolyspora erythraea]ASU77836.1 hypothetical protein CDG81_05380 [Actinopolyspora erythraea]KGI79825.1 hypothetical protein IL38_20375 [Actinopolyspora erythraea]
MTMAAAASADTKDNDGINVLDDNNISAVPIQLCGNEISALIGINLDLLTNESSQCVNAPVVDHPKAK